MYNTSCKKKNNLRASISKNQRTQNSHKCTYIHDIIHAQTHDTQTHMTTHTREHTDTQTHMTAQKREHTDTQTHMTTHTREHTDTQTHMTTHTREHTDTQTHMTTHTHENQRKSVIITKKVASR